MKQSTLVLHAGELRNATMFNLQLEELTRSKYEPELLLVTWEREINRHKDFLIECLNKYPFLKVFGIPYPAQDYKDFDFGKLVPRMINYHHAFRLIDSNRKILISRPDVFFDVGYYDLLTSLNSELTIYPTTNFPTLLQRKLVLLDVEVTDPFFSSDLLIFGTLEDLRKLVSLDIRFDLLFSAGPAKFHNRRFVAPFISVYPLITRFFFSHSLLGTHQGHFLRKMTRTTGTYPVRRQILEHTLETREYAYVLALYYKIVMQYILIRRPKNFYFRTIPEASEFDTCVNTLTNNSDAPIDQTPSFTTFEEMISSEDCWGAGAELFTTNENFFKSALQIKGIPEKLKNNFEEAVSWLDSEGAVFSIPETLDFNTYESNLSKLYHSLTKR